jgi:Transposase domain (DUF772)
VRCDYTVGTVATDLGDVMVLYTLPTNVRYRGRTGLLWCIAESTRLTDAVEKSLRISPNSDSGDSWGQASEAAMMGRQIGDQTSLFYEFRLDDRIPKGHLLRRINVFLTPVLASMHEQLAPYYSEIGRPSIDPELMVRMLIVGYCYGVRSERKLTQEVELHLAYRWFCRLDLDDKVPHHSTFRRTGCIGFGRAMSFAGYTSWPTT